MSEQDRTSVRSGYESPTAVGFVSVRSYSRTPDVLALETASASAVGSRPGRRDENMRKAYKLGCRSACMSNSSSLVLAAVLSLTVVPMRAQQPPAPARPAPAARPSPPARLSVNYQMFTMSNGLTVILHEDHRVPRVAINIWYRVGSANERPGRTGFAHLFEHLMFEGSGHVKEGQFDNLLEAAGGDNNASTWND